MIASLVHGTAFPTRLPGIRRGSLLVLFTNDGAPTPEWDRISQTAGEVHDRTEHRVASCEDVV